jgi:hypothetical protein
MILLVTRLAQEQCCLDDLEQSVKDEITVARDFSEALKLLQAQEFAAVVIDSHLVDSDPAAADALLPHLGTAISVQINLAINGERRVARELRMALARRDQENALALRAAISHVNGEVRSALTGILLSTELALAEPKLPASAQAKMRSVHDLAKRLRNRLDQKSVT